MSSMWYSIFPSATSVASVTAMLIFTLAFWKLDTLTHTPTSRAGLISSCISLALHLFYGTLWVVAMLPNELSSWVFRIYTIPQVWTTLWVLSIISIAATLVCLALTLRRGIHPRTMPTEELG